MSDLQSILDAVNLGLSVVKRVADMGGSVVPYASTLSNAIGVVQQLVKTGADVAEEIQAITDTFSKPMPAQGDLDRLDATIAASRARLHAPLPPAEPGEED